MGSSGNLVEKETTVTTMLTADCIIKKLQKAIHLPYPLIRIRPSDKLHNW